MTRWVIGQGILRGLSSSSLIHFYPRRSCAPRTIKRVRAADRSDGHCAHEFLRAVRMQHGDTAFASCSCTAHTRRAACIQVHAMKGAYISCEAHTPHATRNTSCKVECAYCKSAYTACKGAYMRLMQTTHNDCTAHKTQEHKPLKPARKTLRRNEHSNQK